MTGERMRFHGIPGQMNVCVLDVDSDITGFGKHNRLTVFSDPHAPHITIREDLRGLPLSTEAQRRKVANGWQRMHPTGRKLTFVSSLTWHNTQSGHDCIDHEYRY